MYGVDLHKAKVGIFYNKPLYSYLIYKIVNCCLQDSADKELDIGVTCNGLVVFQNNIRINTLSWAKIVKISFKRRHFFVQLRREMVKKNMHLMFYINIMDIICLRV